MCVLYVQSVMCVCFVYTKISDVVCVLCIQSVMLCVCFVYTISDVCVFCIYNQ